jgi:hypothetical protein
MTTDLETATLTFHGFLADARAKAADGISWSEFGELFFGSIRLGVAEMGRVVTIAGTEKKAQVLGLVGRLFDTIADRAVPFYLLPVWYVVKPAVRSILVALASGAIEQILPLVRAST